MRDELIQNWLVAVKALESAKALEMDLRTQVSKLCFPEPTEGTNTLELGNGYKLKLQHKFNYTLGGNEEVEMALNKIANTDNEGNFIAERLVNWKPSLAIKEYREADEKYKVHLNKVLTIKPASPALEFVEPKGK